MIRLENCTLSICNASDPLAAYHPDVAFFRTGSAPGADLVPGEESRAAKPPATINLVNCIARGEAVFLCATEMQPLQLSWENGLLVTTEQMLWSLGGQEMPQPGEMLQLDLQHLTAVARGGFFRLTETRAAPHQLDAEIYCADSILMAGPGGSLIEQEGSDSLEDLRQQIAWIGDRNFYENFEVFWRVRNLELEPLCEPMTFAAWQSYWGSEEESLPMEDCVAWKELPEANRPLHTHAAADYALADSTHSGPNPAQEAGFQAAELPQRPAPPGVEEPQPPEASDH